MGTTPKPWSSASFSQHPGRTLAPSHTYHITKASGELLVLCSKRIQQVLTEVPVGDEEGDRVHLQVQLGS